MAQPMYLASWQVIPALLIAAAQGWTAGPDMYTDHAAYTQLSIKTYMSQRSCACYMFHTVS